MKVYYPENASIQRNVSRKTIKVKFGSAELKVNTRINNNLASFVLL